MRIKLSFPGKSRTMIIGHVLPGVTLNEVKKFWEAEQAINSLTDIRMHLSLEEDIIEGEPQIKKIIVVPPSKRSEQ